MAFIAALDREAAARVIAYVEALPARRGPSRAREAMDVHRTREAAA